MSLNGAVKCAERRDASQSSLLAMHPVASGDNVATLLRSAHRLKDDAPALVPCCEGTELQVKKELIQSGLSAISVKHESVQDCISLTRAANDISATSGFGLVKHRNSFRSLHRPDLRRVPCLRQMAPQALESLFSGYTSPADVPRLEGNSVAAAAAVADPTPEPAGEECVRVLLPAQDEPRRATNTRDEPRRATNSRDEPAVGPVNGGSAECAQTRPLSERRGAEAGSVTSAALPSGMRLHDARARLYTSVQAAERGAPGDTARSLLTESERRLMEQPAGGAGGASETRARGELHIILPPRLEDHIPSEMSTLTADMHSEMSTLTADMHSEMSTLTADMHSEMSTLTADMHFAS